MKRIFFSSILLVLVCALKDGQAANYYDNPPCPQTVKDYDGNVYNTVQIGNQCWMKENLRVKHAKDGSPISLGYDGSINSANRYVPGNNSANVASYGYLYNYLAAIKVCPQGWHLPSKVEFEELISYCAKRYYTRGKPPYTGKVLAAMTGWRSYKDSYTVGNNQSANNASGFSALPAGQSCSLFEQSEGSRFALNAFFWSVTPYDLKETEDTYFGLSLSYCDMYAGLCKARTSLGFSVRCVKD